MDFYQRINIVASHIPYGSVATYGQIALLCQRPNHSRQVGFGLRGGKVGEVPAHRIVNHQGYLSANSLFYPDSQKELLSSEGVLVNEELRVSVKQYGWKTTMADALYFAEKFTELAI